MIKRKRKIKTYPPGRNWVLTLPTKKIKIIIKEKNWSISLNLNFSPKKIKIIIKKNQSIHPCSPFHNNKK